MKSPCLSCETYIATKSNQTDYCNNCEDRENYLRQLNDPLNGFQTSTKLEEIKKQIDEPEKARCKCGEMFIPSTHGPWKTNCKKCAREMTKGKKKPQEKEPQMEKPAKPVIKVDADDPIQDLFDGYPMIYERLINAAVVDFRTPRLQILHILNETLI